MGRHATAEGIVMDPCRARRRRARGLCPDRAGPGGSFGASRDAVTPVVGTVLVLGISVAGIAAVLFWGAPLIQEMQDRSAQSSVTSDLLTLRDGAGRLVGVDASRSIGVNVPAGAISTEGTSHVVVGADYVDAGCLPDLDGWTDGDNAFFVGPGCFTSLLPEPTSVLPPPPVLPAPPVDIPTLPLGEPGPTVYVYKISAATATPVGAAIGVGPVVIMNEPLDIAAHDWNIQVRDGMTGALEHEFWILRSDVVSWAHNSAVSSRSSHFAWGPVVSDRDGSTFADAQFFAHEDTRAPPDAAYYLRLNALDDRIPQGGDSIADPGPHGVYVSLAWVVPRASTSAFVLGFEFAGTQAEAFCKTFPLRDGDLYTTCADDGDETGSPAEPVFATHYEPADPFRLEFLHARIHIDLQL